MPSTASPGSWGRSWAKRGIRVNAIGPGVVPQRDDPERCSPTSVPRAGLSANCPMGRVGRLDELDGVLLFLASGASTYCTGQIIAVDGGWTAR